jgi:hypothetical protein
MAGVNNNSPYSEIDPEVANQNQSEKSELVQYQNMMVVSSEVSDEVRIKT